MTNPGVPLNQVSGSLHLPKQRQKLENIRVEQLKNPPGEGNYLCEDKHTIFISLAPRPLEYLQIQDGVSYNGLYRPGEILITPANVPLFVRWKGQENCLQIQIKTEFLQKIAQETLNCVRNQRFQLMPQFQVHDSHIRGITMMLLEECQQQVSNNQLYLDSLANVLAVNLVRHHGTTKPILPVYQGGLSPHQLSQIFDYIDAHLDQNLKLEDLAQLLDLSQFHFSRLFKQSVGLSPYQYLIEQRIERAKQLLKQTNQSILDIALSCGFNSHSHLTKKFRQVTGITPKAYRIS
ncbi:MAG: AraC family transcriptional regulator [Crocosphaera sp.]|nr:AraC family transcriptional regulator [Crocosphaera sp.]